MLREPPKSMEAEEALLGSLILDGDLVEIARELVEPDQFFAERHRTLYRHMLDMTESGDKVDVVTLFDSVPKAEMEDWGGLPYLGNLARGGSSTVDAVEAYAKHVRAASVRRQMIIAANRISELAYQSMGSDVEQIISEAQSVVSDLSTGAVTDDPIQIKETIRDVINEIESRQQASTEMSGLPTGLVDLDTKLSGLVDGDLIVIAGRPSMGKTALALSICHHLSGIKVPGLVFSLEMSATQLTMRYLSAESRVPQDHLRRGRVSEQEWPKITQALATIHDHPLYLDQSGHLTVDQLRARAKKHRLKHPIGYIVVDYLQLMDHGAGDNQAQLIGRTTRSLKCLAKELAIPVIALSQLSRKVEERQNKRPRLSDLRESGAIEQDADVILLLYRDDYYDEDSKNQGMVEINVGKQRQGPTGRVHCVFRREMQRFENAAPDHDWVDEQATQHGGFE